MADKVSATEGVMSQVLANAIVDVIKPATPVGLGVFSVEVWGKAPYDYTRRYEIQAKNDTLAAQEGIRRFVDEMEKLPAEGN
jgi:hypothetical protein